MIAILILLAVASLATELIKIFLIKLVKIPALLQPLVPLAIGISLGILLFFTPRFAFTWREAILFGIASAGIAVIILENFISNLKPKG